MNFFELYQLLSEMPMKTEIPDDFLVGVKIRSDNALSFYYIDKSQEPRVGTPKGRVEIEKFPNEPFYRVTWSENFGAKGWGPLLYDLAMEFATAMGFGLASSDPSQKGSVSQYASAVWQHYHDKRSDVEKIVQPEEIIGKHDSAIRKKYGFRPTEYYYKKPRVWLAKLDAAKKLLIHT